MSMATDFYAEYANREKKAWTDKLEAILYSEAWAEEKLIAIKKVVEEIKEYVFSE